MRSAGLASLSFDFPQLRRRVRARCATMLPVAGSCGAGPCFGAPISGVIAAIVVMLARNAGLFASLGDRGVPAVAILAMFCSPVNYLASSRQRLANRAHGGEAGRDPRDRSACVPAWAGRRNTRRWTGLATAVSPKSFLLAIGAGLFAFGGWQMVTYTSGETENARRTIPRALIIGTLIVSGCYLALNAAYLYILPLDRILHSTRIAADAAIALVGPNGAAAITALVVISAMGSLNGIILAGPRVYFAMAQDDSGSAGWPRSTLDSGTPHLAIAAQAVRSSVLVGTGTYRVLFTRVVYTEWLFFGLMTIGLLRLRGSRLRWGSIVPLILPDGCVLNT